MQSQEIQSSLINRINQKYGEARGLAEHAETKAVEALNALRETGLLLDEAKSSKHWATIQPELDLGTQAIQMCLTFARKHPDPVVDPTRAIRMLDDIRMTTGLLPFANGHGPQRLHSPNFFSVASKQLGSFQAEWKKQIARSPLNNWETPSLEQFVHQLEPAINEFNGIYNAAKHELTHRLAAGPS